MNKRTITVTIVDDNEDEVEHELPATNEVCWRCDAEKLETENKNNKKPE